MQRHQIRMRNVFTKSGALATMLSNSTKLLRKEKVTERGGGKGPASRQSGNHAPLTRDQRWDGLRASACRREVVHCKAESGLTRAACPRRGRPRRESCRRQAQPRGPAGSSARCAVVTAGCRASALSASGPLCRDSRRCCSLQTGCGTRGTRTRT